jgi:hypothetical protein
MVERYMEQNQAYQHGMGLKTMERCAVCNALLGEAHRWGYDPDNPCCSQECARVWRLVQAIHWLTNALDKLDRLTVETI